MIEKNTITKIWVPFTECISQINNTQIYNTKDIDSIMPMYNLIDYRDNLSKNIRKFAAIL